MNEETLLLNAKCGEFLGQIPGWFYFALPTDTNASAQRASVQGLVALCVGLAFCADWHFLLQICLQCFLEMLILLLICQ